MAHHAGAYPGYCSMKLPEVFLLPPGDASPLQVTPGWRETLRLPRQERSSEGLRVIYKQKVGVAMWTTVGRLQMA